MRRGFRVKLHRGYRARTRSARNSSSVRSARGLRAIESPIPGYLTCGLLADCSFPPARADGCEGPCGRGLALGSRARRSRGLERFFGRRLGAFAVASRLKRAVLCATRYGHWPSRGKNVVRLQCFSAEARLFSGRPLRAARGVPSGRSFALGPAASVAGCSLVLRRIPRAAVSTLEGLNGAGHSITTRGERIVKNNNETWHQGSTRGSRPARPPTRAGRRR